MLAKCGMRVTGARRDATGTTETAVATEIVIADTEAGHLGSRGMVETGIETAVLDEMIEAIETRGIGGTIEEGTEVATTETILDIAIRGINHEIENGTDREKTEEEVNIEAEAVVQEETVVETVMGPVKAIPGRTS